MTKVHRLLKYIRKHIKIAVFLLVVAIGLFFFIKAKLTPQVKFETFTVKRIDLKDTLTLSGNVDAGEKETLAFQTAGKLSWVGVKEGDTVKKGQFLAALDQRALKKSLQKELNTFAKNRLTLDQSQQDTRDVVIGALSRDKQDALMRTAQGVQYDVNNTILNVELDSLSLELANLYTPIAGIVTAIGVKDAGVNIIPTVATFTVVNPTSLYFSTQADQTDVVKLHDGMDGRITMDSYPDTVVPASIKAIGFTPETDQTGTVYSVKMNLDEQSLSRFKLGMTGDVDFILKEKDGVLAVPETYIKKEGSRKYVFGENKNKIYIETGVTIDSQTEVTSGLEANQIIYDYQ
jgi:HlyD family secretion protein